MPHRYFTTEISNGTATLRGADAHHLSRVMRGRLGDTVILCDGNAVEYTATITGFGPETVEFSVEPGYPSAAEPSVEVTLFVGTTSCSSATSWGALPCASCWQMHSLPTASG